MPDVFVIDESQPVSCRQAVVLDCTCYSVHEVRNYPCVSGWEIPDFSGRWDYCCDAVNVTINEA